MKKLFYCICAAGLLVLGACGTKNNDKADEAYAADEACAKCAAAGIEGIATQAATLSAALTSLPVIRSALTI